MSDLYQRSSTKRFVAVQYDGSQECVRKLQSTFAAVETNDEGRLFVRGVEVDVFIAVSDWLVAEQSGHTDIEIPSVVPDVEFVLQYEAAPAPKPITGNAVNAPQSVNGSSPNPPGYLPYIEFSWPMRAYKPSAVYKLMHGKDQLRYVVFDGPKGQPFIVPYRGIGYEKVVSFYEWLGRPSSSGVVHNHDGVFIASKSKIGPPMQQGDTALLYALALNPNPWFKSLS